MAIMAIMVIMSSSLSLVAAPLSSTPLSISWPVLHRESRGRREQWCSLWFCLLPLFFPLLCLLVVSWSVDGSPP
jgi:hypothetical protein